MAAVLRILALTTLALTLLTQLLYSAPSPQPTPLTAVELTGNSLDLPGKFGHVEVQSDGLIGLYRFPNFTIEAWVYRLRDDSCEAILSKDAETGYWLGFCSNTLRFSTGGAQGPDGSTTVPPNLWTHIAITWEQGGQLSYYINGELDFQAPIGMAPQASPFPLHIGNDPGASGPTQFEGHLAEVRLWAVAREQDEIRRTMHVSLLNRLPGLLASFPLDTSARDVIGGRFGRVSGDASLTGPAAPRQPLTVQIDPHFSRLQTPIRGMATVHLPDSRQALLIGGHQGSAPVDQIQQIDTGIGSLTTSTTLPQPLRWPAAAHATSNNITYIFGGETAVSTGSATDSIVAFNPVDSSVRTLAATLPLSASRGAAVYHPGIDRIFLFGGRGGGAPLGEILFFDPTTESLVNTGATLPEPRSFMGTAYSGATGKIYVFGGRGTGPTLETSTIYALTPQSDGTQVLASELPVTLPAPARFLTAVEDPVSRLIYIFGLGNSVVVFDPVTSEIWQSPIGLPDERNEGGLIYDGERRHALYFGGTLDDSERSEVWRIPLGDGPAIPLGRWDFPDPLPNPINAIDGDEETVLIGTTGNGAYRYDDGGQRTHYTPSNLGSASGTVRSVHYNHARGEVWIGSDDSGATLDDGSGLTTFDGSVLGSNRVYAIDTRGDETFLGVANGLHRLPGGERNFVGEPVFDLAHRADGDLWAIVGRSLRHLDYAEAGDPETDYLERCALGFSEVALRFAPNLDWWIVADGEGEFDLPGICQISAAETPVAGNIHSVPIGDNAYAVDVDTDGRIWVAVGHDDDESGGLAAFQSVGDPPTLYTESFNWLNAPVGSRQLISGSVAAADFRAVGAVDERVWAGTDDGKLVTLAQRWQQIDESNRLKNRAIHGVWAVRGRLFLAEEDQLQVLMPDGQSWRTLSNVRVHAVLGDRRGRIWVATDDGIRLFTSAGLIPLDEQEGTPPDGPVHALAEDAQGRIWIGGASGLTLFDRERFVVTLTAANSGLPGDLVQALLADRSRRLWVGTSSGLARLEGQSWTAFGIAQGLPSLDIRDLVQIGSGEIAVSSEGGVTLFDGTGFTLLALPQTGDPWPLAVDASGHLWTGNRLHTATGWQQHLWTNSGLRSNSVSAVAGDGADRVWFAHAPDGGVSVRGAYLPPLANTLPIIDRIEPDEGGVGDEILIIGTGFGGNPADVDVTVGKGLAEVVALSERNDGFQEIRVALSAGNTSGPVSVRVAGQRTTRALSPDGTRPAFCAQPSISHFTPTGGNVGVNVEIFGANFDQEANIYLGSTIRSARVYSPTLLGFRIRADDDSGTLMVENLCRGPQVTQIANPQFVRFDLTVEQIELNQGMPAYPLIMDRQTMLLHYLSASSTRRMSDTLQIDQVEITYTSTVSDVSHSELVSTVNYSVDSTSDGPPSSWHLRDLNMSLNAVARLPLENDLAGTWRVDTTLLRQNQTVATGSAEFEFEPNVPVRVLLVPIMANDYQESDLTSMMGLTSRSLSEIEERIWPTGRVEFYWSDVVYRVKDVLGPTAPFDDDQVEIGDTLELYDASIELDRARRLWNNEHDPDVLVVYGVVDNDAQEDKSRGKAIWPQTAVALNSAFLEKLDFLCDLTAELLAGITLGWLGVKHTCNLELPLSVGWVRGSNLSSGSSTMGHELGHSMGLVIPDAPNGRYFDNFSHSINDELDDGECSDSDDYNWFKTLYVQSGVDEPIVNPGKSSNHQLDPDFSGDHDSYTRGKAIMSYACHRQNTIVYFEPVDLPFIRVAQAFLSTGDFESLFQGQRAAAIERERPFGTAGSPSPRPVVGTRLYVSGILTQSTQAGQIRRVDVLGDEAPLDLSYRSGYWLVQLDGAGSELARSGLFPGFLTPDNTHPDLGFFSATILREDGLARIELRRDEVVLDTFAAGSNPPQVTITAPTGGSFSDGELSVAWTAIDPDGDPLSIAIFYSADDGNSWTFVASSDEGDSLALPVHLLAGTSNARIRVAASDGIHQSSATSNAFSVASQAPQPYISEPTPGAELLEGRLVWLLGSALDKQDERVNADGLRWSSDRDGALGVGADLDVLLSVGSHWITLEAQNSTGLTATTSVSVTILGDYDFDTIPDAEESAASMNPLDPADAYSDLDNDGLPLVVELGRGLDPDNPDSDGDGRNDGDEMEAGTWPGQADTPLAPDQLSVFPQALSFAADLSQDLPPDQEQLLIVSRTPADWSLSADVAWLLASEGQGTTIAGPTILADAYLLTDGFYQGALTVASPTLDPVVVPVSLTVSNSAAHFDLDRDGGITVGDVQSVAAGIGAPDFNYRQDVDRNGVVNEADAGLTAGRWTLERECCSEGFAPSAAVVSFGDAGCSIDDGSMTVDILIDGAEQLAAFEVDLIYDPAQVEITEVTLGPFLGATGRTATNLESPSHDATGRLILGGYSHGAQAGVDGNGLLGSVSMRVKTTGNYAELALARPLLAAADGATALAVPGDALICETGAPALLLSEIVATDRHHEFIEIYNAGGGAVDLSNVYVTDATWAQGGLYYYNVVTSVNAGGGDFNDFHARFPDGATIAPGAYQTVAIAGSQAFAGVYGADPTYELYEDGSEADNVPDMRAALPGSIATPANSSSPSALSGDGEVVILYYWDGSADLVTDLDYVLWGNKAEAVDKSTIEVDGPDAGSETSGYRPDTAIQGQAVVAENESSQGTSWQRGDMAEGMERRTGGNGFAGQDETSENLNQTWCEAEPSPNAAGNCPLSRHIHLPLIARQ